MFNKIHPIVLAAAHAALSRKREIRLIRLLQYSLYTHEASGRAFSMFAFKAVNRTHLTVLAAVCMGCFGRQARARRL